MIKFKQNDVCGDCGYSEPTWASLNRGIYLCVHCCSVHRRLGSHVSQIKSLQKSQLRPSQLATLETLNSFTNNIWEHVLLQNGSKSSKRKPTADDIISTKSAYIILKHQKFQYAFRQNKEDGLLCVENELGKQLHASVRTNKLEVSFRLLTQGADPNYFHDEKGTTPLHNAVKARNMQQCELLIIFGADPTIPDTQGHTSIDYAKSFGTKEIAQRLVECQYEITDKFSSYLWHKRPDHQNGIHFLMKEYNRKSGPECMAKLRKLPNHVFEELVMDVYDEIDRREIEAIWMGSADTTAVQCEVPFLPVDPRLSSTRNQSRQKLGRFTSPELMALVYDILTDTQRRQILSEKNLYIAKGYNIPDRGISQFQDDDPLYDSVASDEDYATVTSSVEDIDNISDSTTNKVEDESRQVQSKGTLEMLTKRLTDSDNTITTLKSEVTNLKMLVEHLSSENYELKTKLSQNHNEISRYNGEDRSPANINREKILPNGLVLDEDVRKKPTRPSSMYETREGLHRTQNWQLLKNQLKQNEQNRNIATQSLYGIPNTDAMMHCSSQIVRATQELLLSMQNNHFDNCLICADKIKSAVTNMTASLPSDNNNDLAKRLLDFSLQLQMHCACLQTANKAKDSIQTDFYLHRVRECAYEIAKYTKAIIVKYAPNEVANNNNNNQEEFST